MLGTKKYEKIKKSADRRGQAIIASIEAYNAVVQQLQRAERPAWIMESLLPHPIDRRTVFSTDLDQDLWAEITLGSAWTTLWQHDPQRPPAQPWTYDVDVRQAMKQVLLLDRITEERERLAKEVTHTENWLRTAAQAAWNAFINARAAGESLILYLTAAL